MNRMLRWILLLVVVLAAWEASYRAGLLNPIIFGSPGMIAKAVVEDGWTFLAAFRLTLVEILLAVFLAWILGVGFGILVGASDAMARFTAPVLSALIAVPLIILYPLIIAWIGLGPNSKVVFGFLSGIFPIALNTLIGVREIEPGYARMAQAMGASRVQILFQVLAPLALPAIASGLRLGTALIIIAVVLSEMLGATDGLGFWISYHRSLFNTGQVYLGILLALSIAGLSNALLFAIERRFAPHRGEEFQSTHR
jgi:NitT/TauT family transport system permease protein/taurine transport system permease protein